MFRKGLALGLVFALLLAAGCGPKIVPVEGTVTLDGSPLAGAAVTLLPVGKGESAFGVADSSGKFTLATRGKTGAYTGDYTVTVGMSAPGTGGPAPKTEEEKIAMMKKAAEMKGPPIPTKESQALTKAMAKYASSPLKVTVVAGTPLTIALTSQ